MQQLALFLDGDWAGVHDSTSLQRLRAMAQDDSVRSYYDAGSDTVISPNMRMVTRQADPVLSRASRAYEWLSDHYTPGTQLYVFGFSSGATVALRLARMLAHGGLVRHQQDLIEQVAHIDQVGILADGPDGYEAVYTFRKQNSFPARIHFLGLLDAAAPLSHERELPWLRHNRVWISDGRLVPVVDHAFNAMALDENRDLYVPIRWRMRTPLNDSSSQRWFRGSHRDLGSSVTDELQPLAFLPLERLATEAALRGFKLRPGALEALRLEQRALSRLQIDYTLMSKPDPASFEALRHRRFVEAGEVVDPSATDQVIVQQIGVSATVTDAVMKGTLRGPQQTGPGSTIQWEGEALYKLNRALTERRQTREGTFRGGQTRGTGTFRTRGTAKDPYPQTTPQKEDRFLFAQWRQSSDSAEIKQSQPVKLLTPKQHTWICVKIGPKQVDWKDWLPEEPSEAFPDNLLHKQSQPHELTVVLSAPGILKEPLQKTVKLPKTGNSETAEFDLGALAGEGEVCFRIMVLHQTRLLQGAELRASFGGGQASLTVDAAIAGMTDLHKREKMDACLFIDDTPQNAGETLMVSGDIARSIAVDSKDLTLTEVIKELGELARDAEQNAKPLTSTHKLLLLRNLAVRGERVFKLMQEVLEGQPGADHMPPHPTRIQIVAAQRNDIYLVEFIYDYPPPRADEQDIELCPNWRADAPVSQGTARGCMDECALVAEGRRVCPNGFWGVKKLIERHQFKTGQKDPPPVTQRPVLALKGAAALGVSNVVKEADALASTDSVNDMTVALKSTLGANPTTSISSWKHLTEVVAAQGPPLIVLLPHIDTKAPYAGEVAAVGGIYLEIEKDVTRSSAISGAHLKRGDKRPLVLLLGCQASVVYSKFDDCVADFRNAGAAATIAPIATVAPTNVTLFVTEFLGSLKNGIGPRHAFIGEALRRARRTEFFRGNLLALGIMGFGDADWQISLGNP